MTDATHPFFGNQYTNGGYVRGSFKFPEGLTRKIGEPLVKTTMIDTDVVIQKVNATSSPAIKVDKNAVSKIIKPQVNNTWVVPVVVITALVAGGSYLVYRYNKKKRLLEIPNVGVCECCGEPLTGARFVADSDLPYIVCKKCGEKNYAHYSADADEDIK